MSNANNNNNNILITPAAYAKMLLHARKHPTQPLSGILVGKMVASTLFISDAVPLTHTQVATLPHPIIEVGIKMAHAHACSTGCAIVGTYYCNERFEDNENLNDLNKRMVRTLAEMLRGAGSKGGSLSGNVGSGGAAGAGTAASGAEDDETIGSTPRVPESASVALLLDNAAMCHEDGPAAVVACKVFSGSSANAVPQAASRIAFSTWNRDTGAPDAPQQLSEVRTRLEALLGTTSEAAAAGGGSAPLWDFEEHLEKCDTRNFFNPWIC